MNQRQIEEFLSGDETTYLFNTTTFQVISYDPEDEDEPFASVEPEGDTLFSFFLEDTDTTCLSDTTWHHCYVWTGTDRPSTDTVMEALSHGDWQPLTRENVMRAWLEENKDKVKDLIGLADAAVVANRVNVPCRFGTLTASPQGDPTGIYEGIEVDFVTPDGKLRQVALAETVPAEDLREGVTGLHTFAWDGSDESPTAETWCDPESEYVYDLVPSELAEVRDTRNVSDVVHDAIAEDRQHTLAWIGTEDVDNRLDRSDIGLTDTEKKLVVRDVCDNLSTSEALWDLINDQIDVEGKARIRDRYGLNDLSFEQGTRLLEAVREGRIEGACDMDPLTIALARNSYFRDALLTEIAAHSDPDQLRMVVSEITGRNPHDVPSTTETFAALDKAATETAAAKQTKDSLAAQSTHNKETHR